jgi:hypothetical protein
VRRGGRTRERRLEIDTKLKKRQGTEEEEVR